MSFLALRRALEACCGTKRISSRGEQGLFSSTEAHADDHAQVAQLLAEDEGRV